MRVSTSMIFDAGVGTINRQTGALLHLQQQVASGRRILTPADDPVNAARALEVTQAAAVITQFKENHNNVNSTLGIEEAQLSSASDLITRVRELAVQAGNSSLTSSDRRALAFELRARFDELIGIANATDGTGMHIFSGYMGTTTPFGGSVEDILAGNEIVYQGDEGQRRLQVSPTRFLEISDSGNDVFRRISDGNGYFVTGYNSSNTGGGVIDSGSITAPATWNALAVKNYRIDFTVDGTAPPVTYYDIVDNDPVSATYNQSLLTGSAAPAPLPSAGSPSLRQYIPGQPIVFTSQGSEAAFDLGVSLRIDGNPANGDSFTVLPSNTQSVFATIAELVGVLESANTGTAAATAALANDIGFALTNLDQAGENILRVRAAIGSRMAELESLGSVNEDLQLQYQQTLSRLEDLDYAKAISDLTRKQNDLEAAQKSFLISSKLSLFNYI